VGEYWHIVNLDKKEMFATPPYKFWEWMANEHSKVLFWLCAKRQDMKRGFGSPEYEKYPTLGRWAGDRVIVIGDYDPEFKKIIAGCKDITLEVLEDIERYFEEEGPKEIYLIFKDYTDFMKKCREGGL